MYLPRQFEENRVEVLHRLMIANPFAMLVTHSADQSIINHIPFILDTGAGPHGTLRGHVAKANPVWKTLSDNVPAIVVFQGADHYISPSWYPSKQEHGKVVPTWNYAIVHASGFAGAVTDKQWLSKLITDLTDHHESRFSSDTPWRVSDAPDTFVDQMLNAIVGIEIPITQLTGKWKVSQNRTQPDRSGVISGLQSLDGKDSQKMAELVAEKLDQ